MQKTLLGMLNELENCYKLAVNLDSNKIDIDRIKKEIIELNEKCQKLDSNPNQNAAVEVDTNSVLFTKLYQEITRLNQVIATLPNILDKFSLIDSINVNVTDDIYNEAELQAILDIIDTYKLYENYLLENELNERISIIYSAIKTEFRYTGKSKILEGLLNHGLVTDELKELVKSDSIRYLGSDENYFTIKKIFEISVKEHNFLNSVEEKLSDKLNTIGTKRHRILEIKKGNNQSKKKANKNVNKGIGNIIWHFFPFILSISIMIGANKVDQSILDKGVTKYSTKKETYSSVSGSSTMTEYEKGNVGDMNITIYYPTKENGTRVIKTYNLNNEEISAEDYEQLDLDNMNFTSSVYKYDEEANKISTDKFVTVDKIVSVDSETTYYSKSEIIISHIIVSSILLVFDLIIHKLIKYKDFSTFYNITGFLGNINIFLKGLEVKIAILKDAIENRNLVYGKEEIKQIKKDIKLLEEDYRKIYEKYSYLEEFLKRDNYSKGEKTWKLLK